MARALTEAELDRRIEALQWWKSLRETNNDAFMPLFCDDNRYLVLCGGGGSGKSIFAGRKILERVTTEPGHRWLVCRKVARTLRQSCFTQLISQAIDFYPDSGLKINKSDMLLTFANGSEIIFAGLDDVEKLKSIYNITGIWVEEASELDEGDFNQLDIRLRTEFEHYLQMILTFNPISITHWLKARFFDRVEPRATTHRSTYRDNRFLTPEAVATLEAFRDTDEYYYTVYCLGQWGVTGKTVFDAKALSRRLAALTEAPRLLKSGFFAYDTEADGIHISNAEFVPEERGAIRIYEEPVEGRPYVIGGDTSGEGSDWFVAQVLDNITGKQVCVLRHQYDEDTFARQIYCLGRYYNDALIGVEANFSTYPIKLLGLMGYQRQYVREVEDEYTGAIRKSFGFRTTATTRPVIIAELIRIMREGTGGINDEVTLQEMLTFVRNDKFRAEAEPGAHDDCVMALAIAYYIRPQQSMRVKTAEPEGTVWTPDMVADYQAASPEERQYLIKKWGPRRAK